MSGRDKSQQQQTWWRDTQLPPHSVRWQLGVTAAGEGMRRRRGDEDIRRTCQLAEPGTRPNQSDYTLAQPGRAWLMSQAEPILVMSRFDGSAWLQTAWLGWLSHFEPSCGNTSTSLGIGWLRWRFHPSNHTRSPSLYLGISLFLTHDCWAFIMSVCACSHASLNCSRRNVTCGNGDVVWCQSACGL